jgi:hypothetical protein
LSNVPAARTEKSPTMAPQNPATMKTHPIAAKIVDIHSGP